MKDSFIFYLSQYQAIACLTNEQLGRLFRTIFEMKLGNEVIIDDDIRIAFNFINNQLNIDADKWEEEKNKRSEAGKKHTGNQYTRIKEMEQMEQCSNRSKLNGTNGTNGTVNVNDNVNENVNVNDIYIAPSEQSSSGDDTAKANNDVKHKFGEYKHVLLKDKELQALQKDYSNWEELIKYLDEYIEMKGYKAKNHYLAIRKWVVDAVKRKPVNTVKQENSIWDQFLKEG